MIAYSENISTGIKTIVFFTLNAHCVVNNFNLFTVTTRRSPNEIKTFTFKIKGILRAVGLPVCFNNLSATIFKN